MTSMKNTIGYAVIEVVYQNRDRSLLYANTMQELDAKLQTLQRNPLVVGCKVFKLDSTSTRQTNWVTRNEVRDNPKTLGDAQHNLRSIRPEKAHAVQD